jgi:membrane associated rhomboid family serine protease
MNTSRYDSYATQGSPTIGPGAITPCIKWLLIANAVMYVLQYLPRLVSGFPDLTHALGLTPSQFLQSFPVSIYQVFTYMFLHAGLAHIFFNMLALWMFGTEIEQTWGTRSFARFYVICGLAGALGTLIVFPNQAIPTIGASGAIWGILVAYWLMFPDRHLYLYFVLPLKVRWAIPGLLLLSIFTAGEQVAHMAHIGGAVCGFLYLKVDWRWNRLSRKIKDLRYRRAEAKLEKRREEAEEIMKKVDAILDKINAVGLDNLTKAERKYLDEASSHLKHRQNRTDK